MQSKEKLRKQNEQMKFVCIGLDSDVQKIPEVLKSNSNPILDFNRLIIESTRELAAAYKFNLAFYEKEGMIGLENLIKSIQMIPNDILIIGDGKRGDIGNTSQKYAETLYDELRFDSATLNPYMGKDSLTPFLEYEDKLNFILALTSNSGAADFEKSRLINNNFLYQEVIEKVKEWNTRSNCGIVFGATKSEELKHDIRRFGQLPVLLPGVGAQGGNIEEIVKIFKEHKHINFLINVSRGVIYKSSEKDFSEAARAELISMNELIKEVYN